MNRLNHVAVIADGNGRWAEQRGLERSLGHEQGLNKVEDMMRWCVDLGIHTLSVYCFSCTVLSYRFVSSRIFAARALEP